jgi:hypothetical protein
MSGPPPPTFRNQIFRIQPCMYILGVGCTDDVCRLGKNHVCGIWHENKENNNTDTDKKLEDKKIIDMP